MAELVYSAIASLDGFVADEQGDFGWAAPSEEVHAHVNDAERAIGTYLYGRRMYEVMAVWQNADEFAGDSPAMRDYAQIWQAASKVVYSRTLADATTERTQIKREFDADEVRRMKSGSGHDISVGGPELAAQALAAGLVDEIHLYLAPVIVGGGNQALPSGIRAALRLEDTRSFACGTVYLRYSIDRTAAE